MRKLSTLTRVTALATTLSLALIGMPGGTALAASLVAELDATSNAVISNENDREEGGFGYVVVYKVRGDTIWAVKVENVAKETQYGFFNDYEELDTVLCSPGDQLGPPIITTDDEGDALVAFPAPKPDDGEDWVHVCRICQESDSCFVVEDGQFMKILTGKLYKGRGGGRP